MTPHDLLSAGQLTAARAAQAARAPMNAAERADWLELLFLANDYPTIAAWLATAPADVEVADYQARLSAQQMRHESFTNGQEPYCTADAPTHLSLRTQAMYALTMGDLTSAKHWLENAAEMAPPIRGTLNGRPFARLTEPDQLLANVLELFVKGNYFWLALEQVQRVTFHHPATPLGFGYRSATITLRNGHSEVSLIPTLYPFTYVEADGPLLAGQASEYRAGSNGPVIGLGARHWQVDGQATALTSVQELVLR
jgi:protein involved in temperature-dependent protein secretion